MEAIHTIEYKGHTINIYPDTDLSDPREWDNLGKIICFHKKYTLGDEHTLSFDDFNDWEDLKNYLIADENAVVVIPLYLYDHSGITISTSKFSSSWDSGQIGFVYVTEKDVEKEFRTNNITIKLSDKIEKILEGEIKTYDDYLKGNVYGYVVEDKQREHIDGCCGFFGDYDGYILKQAKNAVDDIVETVKEEHAKKLKILIKNKVGINKRAEILSV